MAEDNKSALKGVSEQPKHLQGLNADTVNWKEKSLDYWRSSISEEQFRVCRMAGTESPFSGKYCGISAAGDFHCSCCGLKLFGGNAKFDSGTGWPSFSDSVEKNALVEIVDSSHGMVRTEVRCARCDAHLGHVFNDGPPPTGKRYCINSVCLYKEAA